MNKANKMSKSISAWYFKAGETSVKLQTIDINDSETGGPRLQDMHRLLDCHTLDAQFIHTDMGIFSIWFNDLGMYEDFVFNKPASMVLAKLPIAWSNMNGNYLVMFHPKGDPDTYLDIPAIGFKQWIAMCSEALHKHHQKVLARRAEMESVFGKPFVITV